MDRLFEAALELAASERSAFLAQTCGEDEELRRKVEKVIEEHEQAGHFLARPAREVAAKEMGADQARFPPGHKLGHYQIPSLLGAGGMGEVYLARDTRLDLTVALKILSANVAADRDRMQRFVREAKAASALTHPSVATIFDVGEADGTSFIYLQPRRRVL